MKAEIGMTIFLCPTSLMSSPFSVKFSLSCVQSARVSSPKDAPNEIIDSVMSSGTSNFFFEGRNVGNEHSSCAKLVLYLEDTIIP